ncbi:MAG: hypothetical protein WKF97_11565 [Chitinophagaceae bacterium]
MSSSILSRGATLTSPNQVEGAGQALNKVRQRPKKLTDPNRLLKKGIWVFFILLIFEGALRKWVLPGLSTPLLVIRDPLAIWLVFMAIRRNIFSLNIYMVAMGVIAMVSIFTAVFLGHGNLIVAMYGARILLIYFPCMFVIGRVFNREDIIKMGKWTLIISLFMTVLLTLQFYSPQSALVNRGVGGSMEGAGFEAGAFGFYRPPGTFTFTTGTTLFYGFAAVFIFYFWFYFKHVSRILLTLATISLVISIPLSISRALFFQVIVSLVFAIIFALRKPQYLRKMTLALIGSIIAIALLGHVSFFETAAETFTARFEHAGDVEGGLKGTLGNRFLGGMILAFANTTEQPFFGHGLGMGTPVGSMLLTGKVSFLIAEEEWSRLIGELGLLMGLGVILVRVMLSLKLAFLSYKRLRLGDLLPWILMSFGFLTLTTGGWWQPTYLGFSTLIGGLIIASLKPLPRAHPKMHTNKQVTK